MEGRLEQQKPPSAKTSARAKNGYSQEGSRRRRKCILNRRCEQGACLRRVKPIKRIRRQLYTYSQGVSGRYEDPFFYLTTQWWPTGRTSTILFRNQIRQLKSKRVVKNFGNNSISFVTPDLKIFSKNNILRTWLVKLNYSSSIVRMIVLGNYFSFFFFFSVIHYPR